jgi:hypothetical protein
MDGVDIEASTGRPWHRYSSEVVLRGPFEHGRRGPIRSGGNGTSDRIRRIGQHNTTEGVSTRIFLLERSSTPTSRRRMEVSN